MFSFQNVIAIRNKNFQHNTTHAFQTFSRQNENQSSDTSFENVIQNFSEERVNREKIVTNLEGIYIVPKTSNAYNNTQKTNTSQQAASLISEDAFNKIEILGSM